MKIGLLRWSGSSAHRESMIATMARAAGDEALLELVVIEEPEPAWGGWETILAEATTLISEFYPATVYAPSGYEFGTSAETALRTLSGFLAAGASVQIKRPGLDTFWTCAADSHLLAALSETVGAITPCRIAATDRLREQKTGRRRALRIEIKTYEAVKADLRAGQQSLRKIAAKHKVALNTVQRVRDDLSAEQAVRSAPIDREPPDHAIQHIRDRAARSETWERNRL